METQSRSGQSAATWFASPERESADVLRARIVAVANSEITDVLLNTAESLLAILNQHRQVLAVNEAILRYLGVDSAERVFGLRFGEAIACVHSSEMPGGCGTSRYCSTCGLAVALVASISDGATRESYCSAQVNSSDGNVQDRFFRIRSQVFGYAGERLVLLYVRDITEDHWKQTVERAFYHDTANLVAALEAVDHLLPQQDSVEKSKLIRIGANVSRRLINEMRIQRAMAATTPSTYRLQIERLTFSEIVSDIQDLYQYDTRISRNMQIINHAPSTVLTTDRTLLIRVLSNMLVNAFEASSFDAEVRLSLIDCGNNTGRFEVWNQSTIPAEIAPRIFQRYYSSKGTGRGLGTYIMKLLGESYLKGRVSFTTADMHGTTFSFELALDGQALSSV